MLLVQGQRPSRCFAYGFIFAQLLLLLLLLLLQMCGGSRRHGLSKNAGTRGVECYVTGRVANTAQPVGEYGVHALDIIIQPARHRRNPAADQCTLHEFGA